MDFRKTEDDVLPPDTYGLYGENQWPDQELPGFSKTYLDVEEPDLSTSIVDVTCKLASVVDVGAV